MLGRVEGGERVGLWTCLVEKPQGKRVLCVNGCMLYMLLYNYQSYVIWYLFNRNWVDTRWQHHTTHLQQTIHTIHREYNSGSAGRAPSLRVFLYVYVFLLLCMFCSVYSLFIAPPGILRLPWLRFFRAFSSVVGQMSGYNWQRRGTVRTLLSELCCSVYCLCVNVYCTTATG